MDTTTFTTRCRELSTEMADLAAEGERERKMPDALVASIEQSGVLGAAVPPSLGGHGLGLTALCEGTRELARGCPAAAWTTSFLMLHAWMLARFPKESHPTLFGSPDAPTVPLAAAPLAPTGSFIPVDGGFIVSGRWEWATAVNHSQWVLVHGIDTSAGFTTRFAAIPTSSVQIDDVWHTSGMRATGSNTVAVNDVFVAERCTCLGNDVREPSAAVADDPMGHIPLLSVLALVSASVAIGAAQAATEAYTDRLRTRVLAYSLGDKAAEQPLAQARLAAVSSDLATTLAGWRHGIATVEGASPGEVTDELRVRTRLAAAAAVRSSRLLIGAIGEGAGASVYAEHHPIQRLQRDVETLKGHAVFDWDRTTELVGRVLLGGSLGPTDMA